MKDILQHFAYQETLTDYLRVALGHFVLDDIESRGEWEDEDDLIDRAYRGSSQEVMIRSSAERDRVGEN